MRIVSTCRTRGFSLIEVPILFLMISVLVGLLVPAVQKAREDEARKKCLNNLKQIGMACHNYVNVHKGLPPLAISTNNNVAPFIPPNTGRGGVYLSILPFLEQKALLANYNLTHDWQDPVNARNTAMYETAIAGLMCPATPLQIRYESQSDLPYYSPAALANPPNYQEKNGKRQHNAGPVITAATDYAPICQVSEGKQSALFNNYITSYSTGAPGTAGNTTMLPGPGAMSVNIVTPLVSIVDGTSNTILFSESAGRPIGHVTGGAAQPPGATGAAPAQTAKIENCKTPAGAVVTQDSKGNNPSNVARAAGWMDRDNRLLVHGADPTGLVAPGRFTNKKTAVCVINCNNFFGSDIYSFHQGGANILFVDGSVRFFTPALTATTLVELVTAQGGEVPNLP